ncbi:hypothetical protein BC833DRAFT_626026 [Globomyces pollinis-pini]|nr:hypothetical protein BC833DRAFT_626026 [Globomyces pollinis-pini]
MLNVYSWHEGEIALQNTTTAPRDALDRMAQYVRSSMPLQHQEFFSALPYGVFGTLDPHGRPWATILAGPSGFFKSTDENHLEIDTMVANDDPWVLNLESSERHDLGLVAGVGVDFSNRRRNKLAGKFLKSSFSSVESMKRSIVSIETTQSLGNCPKYINVRRLESTHRTPVTITKDLQFKGKQLSDEHISHILSCDTTVLATRHLNAKDRQLSDMDCNHRGGPAGFVRVSEDKQSIIWPDYSGNRMFQSLGNIQSDGLAGITFPNFENGDMLYITGTAVNILGENSLMIGQSRITKIDVTGIIFIKGALQLKSVGPTQYSPYNPPVRYLQFENKLAINATPVQSKVTLESVQALSSSVSTFTFKLNDPVLFKPGACAIMDFSSLYSAENYAHMNDRFPQSLNDDHIRTWTISSFPPIDPKTKLLLPSKTFSITVKNKKGGSISTFLHSSDAKQFQPTLRGVSGSFSCYVNDPPQLQSDHLLFIVGGIGITPFLSAWHNLQNESNVDVALLYSCRGDDGKVIHSLEKTPNYFKLFQTDTSSRMTVDDISSIPLLTKRDVYICGPDSFMSTVNDFLASLGVPSTKIHQESFSF